MNYDNLKIIADVAVLPGLALVGYLVKRAAKAFDDKLNSIDAKLDKNMAQTAQHDSDIAVMKFRLSALDGKAQP